MKEYETIYLLKPDLPAEQLSTLKEKFVSTISKSEGHLLGQGDWGKRKLAYEVQKLTHAHYIYLQYLAPGTLVENLERLLKLEDTVLKFLTVKLADEVNVEKRLAEKNETFATPEEVSLRTYEPPRRGYGSDRSYDRGSRSRNDQEARFQERPRSEAPAKEGPVESKEVAS